MEPKLIVILLALFLLIFFLYEIKPIRAFLKTLFELLFYGS